MVKLSFSEMTKVKGGADFCQYRGHTCFYVTIPPWSVCQPCLESTGWPGLGYSGGGGNGGWNPPYIPPGG